MRVNTYIRERVAEYQRLRQAIDATRQRAVEAGRDLSDEEMAQVERDATRARELHAQVAEHLEEAERDQQVAAMQARLAAAGRGEQPAAAAGGPWSLLPSANQLAQLRKAVEAGESLRFTHGREAELALRATVELADAGGPVAAVSGGLPAPRRLVTAVGLEPRPADTRGGSGAVFGATSGTSPTAEGETKPEADAITAGTIDIQALARWTDISRLGLLSQPGMEADIAAWHAQAIAKDEDLLIVTALEAAGVPALPAGADAAGAVRTAIATVTDAVSADADVVVCHPADYAVVAAFSPSSADDVASFSARIGPALIYPTSAASEGTVTVAALRAGGRFLVAMAPTTAALENLKTNEITIRTEELVGFGLRLAGAVKSVDLEES